MKKKRRKRRNRGRFLIRTGLLMLLAAAMLSAYNILDARMADRAADESVHYLETVLAPITELAAQADAPLQAAYAQYTGESIEAAYAYAEVEIPDYILNPNMEMPVVRHDGHDYIGVLEIPDLKLKLPVIGKWSYNGFRKAPCRYAGSPYTDDMVIAAHNYAAHFGNLDKLGEGAEVRFTDMDGNEFAYQVEMTETLGPRDVEYMLESGWDLSLFTCTPGGSYRVTVRCSRVRDDFVF